MGLRHCPPTVAGRSELLSFTEVGGPAPHSRGRVYFLTQPRTLAENRSCLDRVRSVDIVSSFAIAPLFMRVACCAKNRSARTSERWLAWYTALEFGTRIVRQLP